MSLYTRRRSSLRQSLSRLLLKKPLVRIKVDKLKGRYLFRAAVRLVLEYIEWIFEKPVIEEISDDVTINIRMIQQKYKREKKLLTLEDRSILLINPPLRSSANRAYIYDLIKKLHAFTKYSEKIQKHLAAVCVYQYLPAGRVIVRQGHKAHNLYFIANGDVSLSKIATDALTGDRKNVDMGILQSGDMFGEIALFHRIPRSATVVSKTPVDLFLVTEYDFNKILRDVLTETWNVLRDALINFNYFKSWDEDIIRECCILSKVKDFKANEVILGDGKGSAYYVHFILSGECRLIEHLLIRKNSLHHGTRYKLFDRETAGPEQFFEKAPKRTEEFQKLNNLDYKLNQKAVISKEKHTEVDRLSIVTTALLDVVKEWHEITDVVAMLMREPSVTSQLRYPSDVHTIFMEICTFTRGACFGLGENMLYRRIVAITPVRCFLIPRYWLYEHNRANIWGRVKSFLDSKYPTKERLFHEFICNKKWMMYKQNLVKDTIKEGHRARNNTTIYDVPYSIRITNKIDLEI